MREIKFRQPIRDREGKFIEWFYWGFIDGQWISPAISHEKDTREECQQLVAGYKDKINTEIYEGDILGFSKCELPKGKVVFIECGFCLEWDDDTAEKTKEPFSDVLPIELITIAQGYCKNDWLVLGNICENDNLLKLKLVRVK